MSVVNLTDDMMDLIGDAKAEADDVAGWLSMGFAPLNKILSGHYDGGVGYGRLYEMFGPSSSGKTIVATVLMIEAQRAGGIAILVDYEQAFMLELAEGMGLNGKALIHIQPTTWEEGQMKAAQVAERIRAKKMIPGTAPILIVTDSIAAAVPRSVMEKELDEMTMNDTTALARATSSTLKVLAGRFKRSGVTGFYLNQIRTKPGVVYGDPTTTPGGNAMEFYSSGRISVGRKKIMDKGEGGTKEMKGQLITFKCVKSKHTRPFQETEMYFMFNEDGSGRFDITRSLLDHLIKIGKLSKSGARIAWTDGKTYFQNQLVEKIDSEGLQSDLFDLLDKA